MSHENVTTAGPEVNQLPPLPPTKEIALRMDDAGLIKIETLADEMRVCATLVAAKMVPESFDTAQKLFAARQLCRELKLPVMAATRQVCVINGNPSLWGDLPLSIVRASGHFGSIDEYFVDDKYQKICLENKNLGAEIFAAICEIERKGEGKRTFFFTVEMAKRANLWGTKAIWKLYRERMLAMKARGLALKNVYPDVLMGVAMAEYDFDTINGQRVVGEVSSATTDAANQVFGPTTTGESQQQGGLDEKSAAS